MLDINPVLLLSSAVLFLIVLARLNSCLYKPLIKHMDDRALSIKNDIANAKSNNAELEEMLQEAKSVIARAKSEAAAIREKAYNDAKSRTQGQLDGAKANLDAKYVQFSSELQSQKVSLKEYLVNNIPSYQEQLRLKLSSIWKVGGYEKRFCLFVNLGVSGCFIG